MLETSPSTHCFGIEYMGLGIKRSPPYGNLGLGLVYRVAVGDKAFAVSALF